MFVNLKIVKDEDCLVLCDFETTGLDTDLIFLPIQASFLFLDSEFRIIGAVNKLIKHDEFATLNDWPELCEEAYNVHNIGLKLLNTKGVKIKDVRELLEGLMACIREKYNTERFILASDNTYFDMRVVKTSNLDGLFHYNPVDLKPFLRVFLANCSALYNYSENKIHRSLDDVMDLYNLLLLAKHIGNQINNPKKQNLTTSTNKKADYEKKDISDSTVKPDSTYKL